MTSDAEYVKQEQTKALDAILARRPLRLPYVNAVTREQCARLGIPVAQAGEYVLMVAKLPPGWTLRRTEHRHITICDDEDRPLLEAFYKFAPHETRTALWLTREAYEVLRERWAALPNWRRRLEDPAHWAIEEAPVSPILLWCARHGLLPVLHPRQEDLDTMRQATRW